MKNIETLEEGTRSEKRTVQGRVLEQIFSEQFWKIENSLTSGNYLEILGSPTTFCENLGEKKRSSNIAQNLTDSPLEYRRCTKSERFAEFCEILNNSFIFCKY